MVVNDLKAYGGSELIIKILASNNLKEFYPPQGSALEAGLLRGEDSFVVAAPTASGKTLIAEMAALKIFFERRGKIIYLVPLRALAREKYEDFSKKYKDIGMKVIQSTGDYDSAEPWLYNADLIIATNEKMDSLIRHHTPWLNDVSLVVADEIHILGDPHRGPTLEIVITRLKSANPALRIIALSATIPNADEIARWLDARLTESDWRPVPLREGVYFNDATIFNDGTVRWIPRRSRSDVFDLAVETIEEGGQALIFVNTRRATEAVAHQASTHMPVLLTEQMRKSLKELSELIIDASPEPTRLCRKLADCVAQGVAFHHAGINHSQRKIIEDAFRANRIKLIAATTTLAMGLNLPSRRVIIRDWWRYKSGLGIHPIPAIEIKQMSGRAGRPGYDDYGEAILIAKNRRDEQYLFKKYIAGEPEKIDSQLAGEAALRTHILASIAGAFTRNRKELIDFLSETFFAFQKGTDYLSPVVDDIIDFLDSEGLIVSDRESLMATRFGRRVSELYIDPVTGVMIRDSLQRFKDKEEFSLLHMIARTPDMISLALKKRDREEMLDIFYAHADELLIPESERYPTDDILSELKTASLLMQWILETPEDRIVGHFGVGPGDLRTLIELSEWLLYSAGEIGKIFGMKDVVKTLSQLRIRVLYGIKEELLQLVSLRGIGRVRARNLYDSGYKTIKDIREAGIEELANIKAIGRSIAEDIKRQVLQQEIETRIRAY
ncbi:MAG: DEAD/DEAH box helicase [Nitrospirota bacterium]